MGRPPSGGWGWTGCSRRPRSRRCRARPRRSEAVKEIIARGITDGHLAYVGKRADGSYEPFVFQKPLRADEVEISDEMLVLRAEDARRAMAPSVLTRLELTPTQVACRPGEMVRFIARGWDQHGREMEPGNVRWTASGGTIEADGALRVGETVGTYTVQAIVADMRVEARLTVSTTTGLSCPPSLRFASGGFSSTQACVAAAS